MERSIEEKGKRRQVEMPQLSLLAPNLSDAETLMRFHVSYQTRSDSPLGVHDGGDLTQN